MALSTYTTYDAIRAILGVSPKEIKDATLALDLFEQQFLLEMSDVDSGAGAVMVQYNIVKALTSGRTADQQRFFDIVNMMAAYSAAKQVLTGAPLAVPQKITDGKASIQRFDTHNFDKVRAGATETYAALLRRLKAVLLTLAPGAAVTSVPARTLILSSALASDPVTGV